LVARVLVATALEDTWPKDGAPILFLGEWCKLYDRKHIWQDLDYEVVPYHWDDRNKLYNDNKDLSVIYESTLTALADKLNEVHGVNRSLRYWRILIGPWLGYFIQILFDRWYMLRRAAAICEFDIVRVIKRKEGDGVPNDMADFTSMFVEDDWNDMICGKILHFMSIPLVNVKKESACENLRTCTGYDNKTAHTGVKERLYRIVARFYPFLTRPDEYFFISSYLSIKQDFLLQIKLGQIPKLWRSPPLQKFGYSASARNWSLTLPDTQMVEELTDFRALVSSLVPKNIPTAYLEGYPAIKKIASRLPWPRQPKLIFTANCWNSDDLFKIWAAEKTDQGVPLVLGQHGGNYGIALQNFNEELQISISDRFLTWGWEDFAQKKLKSIGILKGFDNKKIQFDKRGKALLVEFTMPRYSYHMFSIPVAAGQWEEYFEDQCRFVNALPEELRRELLVRLPMADYGYSQSSRWLSHFPDIKLDEGARPMLELLKQARLYISTYNATTYLESLSLNFPTLIFWNPGYWEMRKEVQPYFELLKEAEIFHETPESAAQKMAAVWDNIDGWWYDLKTQKAREVFCEQFAHIPAKPLDTMASLFRELSSNFRSKFG
jgi:putative transferase (TIGR04331 family)